MVAVFVKVLNMSIAAGWLILAVAILRACLKRAPRWMICLLWAAVGVRLVCPFSLESALSLVPSAQTFNAYNIQFETPAVQTGSGVVNYLVNPVLADAFAPDPTGSVNPLYVWLYIAGILWAAGMALMLLYAAGSYWRVYRTVRAAAPLRDNIWLCDGARSPFILGVIRPRICLPSSMDPETAAPVLAHETAHLRRRDHWWKPLGFLILTVHWFNPLCWLAYRLLCRDIELACDEKVIREMDLDGKKAYSTALLECSVRQRAVTVCPLAFGEVGVKERVKSVLRYKKPAGKVLAGALIACAAVGVCFATDPLLPPWLEDVQSVELLVMETGEFQPVSGEAAAELVELMRSYSCTPYPVRLDYSHTSYERLTRTANVVCSDGTSYTLRYNRCQYETAGARIDCANGDTYVLLLDYYKGVHGGLGHLMTGNPGVRCGMIGDDDYQHFLIYFPAGQGPQKVWRMECSFDQPFQQWRYATKYN